MGMVSSLVDNCLGPRERLTIYLTGAVRIQHLFACRFDTQLGKFSQLGCGRKHCGPSHGLFFLRSPS